ncbi:MAG: lysylphosphatidylglycerol synthase transmembrane domain-containing protein [Candidatus Aminicenantales bacterium]
MNKRRIPMIVLSLVLSAVLLYILFLQIPAGDFSGMLASMSLPAVLGYAALSLFSAFLRAWRYRVLLRPATIGWGDMMIVTLVRNAFDDLLPARIGSLSYIYVLNDRLEKPFENAASSFIVAFVLDFATIAPFFILAIGFVGFSEAGIPAAAAISVAAVFFLFFILVVWKIDVLVKFVRNIASALAEKTALVRRPAVTRAFENLDQTIVLLKQTRERGLTPAMFILSLLIRLGKYVSLFILLFAVLHGQGVAWADLSFWKTVLGLNGAELTAALPVKGLAGFGTWESAWVATMHLMRFDPRLAILSGLGIHLVTNVFEYTLAISCLFLLAFRRKRGRMVRNS